MYCSNCSSKLKTANSRSTNNGLSVWRRRYCTNCKRTVTTYEHPELETMIRITSKGSIAPYRRHVLLSSLIKACDHLENGVESALALTSTIEKQIIDSLSEGFELSSDQLYSFVCSSLKQFNTPAYVKYRAQRDPNLSEKDLG